MADEDRKRQLELRLRLLELEEQGDAPELEGLTPEQGDPNTPPIDPMDRYASLRDKKPTSPNMVMQFLKNYQTPEMAALDFAGKQLLKPRESLRSITDPVNRLTEPVGRPIGKVLGGALAHMAGPSMTPPPVRQMQDLVGNPLEVHPSILGVGTAAVPFAEGASIGARKMGSSAIKVLGDYFPSLVASATGESPNMVKQALFKGVNMLGDEVKTVAGVDSYVRKIASSLRNKVDVAGKEIGALAQDIQNNILKIGRGQGLTPVDTLSLRNEIRKMLHTMGQDKPHPALDNVLDSVMPNITPRQKMYRELSMKSQEVFENPGRFSIHERQTAANELKKLGFQEPHVEAPKMVVSKEQMPFSKEEILTNEQARVANEENLLRTSLGDEINPKPYVKPKFKTSKIPAGPPTPLGDSLFKQGVRLAEEVNRSTFVALDEAKKRIYEIAYKGVQPQKNAAARIAVTSDLEKTALKKVAARVKSELNGLADDAFQNTPGSPKNVYKEKNEALSKLYELEEKYGNQFGTNPEKAFMAELKKGGTSFREMTRILNEIDPILSQQVLSSGMKEAIPIISAKGFNLLNPMTYPSVLPRASMGASRFAGRAALGAAQMLRSGPRPIRSLSRMVRP